MDYTVHLTEGYIMAKKFTDFDDMSNKVSFAKVLVWFVRSSDSIQVGQKCVCTV